MIVSYWYMKESGTEWHSERFTVLRDFSITTIVDKKQQQQQQQQRCNLMFF